MNQFVRRLKYIKLKDICQIGPMVLGYFYSLTFRLAHRNIWLVCERRGEARDNGYWFYRYLCECHPEVEAVYAIDKRSQDYVKVAHLGRVIQFGTLMHWTYYWAARWIICSQKNGKPNAALCYLMEVYLGCRRNRVFLQHGIIINDLRWLYHDVTKMNLFVCSTIPEFRYVKEHFGYPAGSVRLCGLCRYDNLQPSNDVKRQILVMPTQREWIAMGKKDMLSCEGTDDVAETTYFRTWNGLLHSKRMYDVLDQYDVSLLFYPHAEMQKWADLFSVENGRIAIGKYDKYDVQQLLMESALLITDYSSVSMDFAYLQKPIIYYHFDYDRFRSFQYKEGYFSYERDGFGPVAYEEEQLVGYLKQALESGMKMDEQYIARADAFFTFRDKENRERTYRAIVESEN